MAEPIIPRPQVGLTDDGRQAAGVWYDFFLALRDFIRATGNVPAEILELFARVEALENGEGNFQIQGLASIRVDGTPQNGVVQIQLRGDNFGPGTTYYYGTNVAGTKGWYTVESTIEVSADELTKAVDAGGVTTLGLADVADGGAGVLQRTAFDAKGRKTDTSAATTDDLAEGAANLYFTDERAQDAVGAALDGTGDVPLSYDDATNTISAALSAAVLASLALADSALQPHVPIIGVGSGTPYVLTDTPAAVDMGTSDPIIVLDEAGTYLIRGFVQLDQAAGTVTNETVALALTRTNNTPADLPDGALTMAPMPTTALTYTVGVIPLPEVVYTTANTDDELTIFAGLSALLGAGDMQISSAKIIAERIG